MLAAGRRVSEGIDQARLRLAVRLLLARRRRSDAADTGPLSVAWWPERDYLESVLDRLGGWFPRECPICGHRGYFTAHGFPPRFDARCPACGCFERHRLVALWVEANRHRLTGRRILHFAPEPGLQGLFQSLGRCCLSADIRPGRAERQLDITALDLPDGSFDVIVCSHVLEHVDDAQALAEMHRVLSPGGFAILMTPLIESWDRTYENPSVFGAADRWLHFGQDDHLRYYGRDIAERISEAGFEVARFVSVEPYVSRHGLIRGEAMLIGTRKP
jgi:SAM-dependent methyltransferase